MSRTAFYAPAAKFAVSFAALLEDIEIMSEVFFPTPGAVVERELGIPFAAGMDDITVDTAELELRTKSHIVNAMTAPVAFGAGAVAFDLGTEGRLTEIELTDNVTHWPPTSASRLVIRAATRQGDSYVAGAPLIAEPGFNGEMFGVLLGGMTILDTRKVRFPPITGTAFIVTWANGSSATSLTTDATKTMGVKQVKVEAVPRDASVTLVAGETEVPVWNQPGPLLPGRLQSVSFVPAAERLLRAQLATGAPPALAVTLRFRSAAESKLEITSPALTATYRAEPKTQPLRASLRGSYEQIALDAPATRAPSSSELRVTAKYLGRMLNEMHDATSDAPPLSGLRIDGEKSVAARVPLKPASLAGVRVQVAVLQASEIALELRADAAGGPGAPLAPQAVRQLAAPFVGWYEIELPSPVAAGEEFVWVTLRATKGEVVWCCDAAEDAAARVSDSKRASWVDAESPLQPRAQLFDAVPPPPQIDVRLREGPAWTLTRTGPDSVDYAADAATLPQAVRVLLAAAQSSNGSRATSNIQLFSRAAVDLALANIRLSYIA